jgi:hypothetical protein
VGTPAPDSVKRLVDLFDRERKVYQSPDCKEEQLRAASLTVRRSSFGIRTFLGSVIHEESIKVAGALKAPDYTFGASLAANVPLKRSAA